MEIAAAILSAALSSAVSSAVPKLGSVIDKSVGKVNTDAKDIKVELLMIQDIIRPSFTGGYVSPSQSGLIAALRHLAYEIEDCIDRFQVEETSPEDFEVKIDGFKKRSKDLRTEYIQNEIRKGLNELVMTSSAQGQGRQRTAPAATIEVPCALQKLVSKQGQDWLNCLLYFCLFPHGHEARRNPLIRRWLAEGLVKREVDAVKYLEAFVDGKIINTTPKSNNGMMKRCQPHDEDILSFIDKYSSATDFMLFCEDMSKLPAVCPRRLSLRPIKKTLDQMNRPDFAVEAFENKNLPDFPYLHTLAVFHGNANPDSYEAVLEFGKYQVLRVLDLKEFAPLSERHILVICKLLLLKYLSFRCNTDHLPREIGKLAWLETLDVDMREGETVTVHKELLMMPRLKHLLGKFQLSKTDMISWNVWGKTTDLGKFLKTTELGKFLKQKSVLQTLSGFVTGERRGFPQLNILMRKLRKVKIWCKSNASKANLDYISNAITKFVRDGKQELGRSLSIDLQECSVQFLNDVDVDGSLTSLKLHGKLIRFPEFVARLSGVVELCLSSTDLTWDVILVGLRNFGILKYLKLVENNLGHVKIRTGLLRSLEHLCLVCVSNLDITIQAGDLPGLVSLHLICQNLLVQPEDPHMHIKHMTHLQEVGLHSAVNSEIKKGWEIGAEQHPNKPNVGSAILC